VLYGYATDHPFNNTLEALQAQGIRVFGHGPGVPAWLPTGRAFVVFLETALNLILKTMGCLVRGKRVGGSFLVAFLELAWAYAYWLDFFSTNRVRVNVGTGPAHVGQILALDALRGVGVTYQHSASNLIFPTLLLTSGEHVQCVFSSAFEQLWRSLGAPVQQYLHTGFIYDGAWQAVRHSRRIASTRRRLEEHGARFILGFFDENSVDRWDIPAPHDEAARDYEYLLTWLLADPTLGLVFKPKRSVDLFQRLDRIAGLIERAKQTGRCVFLTSEPLVGSVFPAEAALMADVCIGKLVGVTAAFEARLAGKPTILIDGEGLTQHPFYSWARGTVVFGDWPSAHTAIEQYRSSPVSSPEFGDWSPGLDDLDPFRDGKASVRLGQYIGWLSEALKQGASPQEALERAGKQYTQAWPSVRGPSGQATRAEAVCVGAQG